MLHLKLLSKDDVNRLKENLRKGCDAVGLRLGKDQHKVEHILATLFDFTNFNTLVGVATKPHSGTESYRFDQFISYVERIDTGLTTYGGKDAVIAGLKSSFGIKRIIFQITAGRLNRSATNVLIVAESGSQLYETLMTVERTPRELEVLNVFYTIEKLGLLHLVRYIPLRGKETASRPCIEVAYEMVNGSLRPFQNDWKGFVAMFNEQKIQYDKSIYKHQEWTALANRNEL
ncbi:hypothetical protein I6M59_01865 [Shewanella algae]|uniref:hypothetical protein n=1 Tax=Shewanella algae TaxID=38313 RepID=UPI001AAD7990|nr:hypothetical protein [Shewanella algae]MBO2690498.1 hypothetical protein [Shewanella algae]MDV2964161.1 hypothetical protein [Shewanella algae]QTE91187.1 hypothetical protein JKK33_01900 [Shewanella algae]